MLSYREQKINKLVQKYSPDLFCTKDGNGTIHIMRRSNEYDTFEYKGITYGYSKTSAQQITSLTHDWSMDGHPVEWGLDLIWNKLRFMDSWRDDTFFDEMVKDRERKKEIEQRSEANELKAQAYDLRSAFNKTFDHYNIGSLDRDTVLKEY